MIQTISEEKFLSYNPPRPPNIVTITEIGWWADDAENICGVLSMDKTDRDWQFAVLGRDTNGNFRGIVGEHSFASLDGAKSRLLEVMVRIEESGETVFPNR